METARLERKEGQEKGQGVFMSCLSTTPKGHEITDANKPFYIN